MKFRVFDMVTGKEVNAGMFSVDCDGYFFDGEHLVASFYTVRFEPDYRVCGNCLGWTWWHGQVKGGTKCAIDGTIVNSPDQKPCEHWQFCGVTE